MAEACDELVLFRFAADSNRKEILQLMTDAGAKMTDISPLFLTFKLVDSSEHIEKLLQKAQKYDLREVLRL